LIIGELGGRGKSLKAAGLSMRAVVVVVEATEAAAAATATATATATASTRRTSA